VSAIITLLTDFGTADSYVAEMKAALLSRVPDLVLVDVTHEIALGDVRSAAYLLARSWEQFPIGTTHLCVVDPGVGTERRALAVRAGGHAFVGPDNGILTPALDAEPPVDLVALTVPNTAAPTFHGRDLFAPAAARLAEGEALEYLGEPAIRPERVAMPRPLRRAGSVRGQVAYVDRFGTLVTNIHGEMVEGAETAVLDDEHTVPVARTFGDVDSGDPVAYVGSGGLLEIAVRDGRASDAFGVGIGARVVVPL
jgi:S-adenosylmethionine hydrolase